MLGFALQAKCLLGVCSVGLGYLVCALKALATGCVLCRPWLLGVCSEGLPY